VEVLRGTRVVARFAGQRPAGRTFRIALRPKRRGVYRVRISAGTATSTLTARKL
jgi:hypothetical protein